MKLEEVIVLGGVTLLTGFLIFIVGMTALSPTGDIIFSDTNEIKISYNEKNPEIIEIDKDVKTEFLIDDIRIKECFNKLDEAQTGIKSLPSSGNTLVFIPKKDGNITFLCGSINTKIIVNDRKP